MYYGDDSLNDNNQKLLNKTLWQLKGVAIISVVCAHCNIQMEDACILYIKNILTNVGSIGVGIFFLLSGYFFHNTCVPLNRFMWKTVKRLVIPWMLAGTFIWLYVALRKGGIGIGEWIHFVLGVNSAFYFMTDLLVMQVIFYILEKLSLAKRCSTVLILLAANEVFIVLESRGYSLFPTPYMDFFCFIGYFALGRYLAYASCTTVGRKLWVFDNRKIRVIALLSCTALIVSPLRFTYFENALSLIFECFFIFTSFLLVLHVNSRLLEWLGKKSFFIYLWHLPIAGILSNMGSRNIVTAYLGLLWPVVILAVMWLVVKIIERLPFSNAFYSVVGLRQREC